MKNNTLLAATLLTGCLLTSPFTQASIENNDEVLVTIDGSPITRGDLKSALTSSPFYTQFNTLNEKNQASMRGDLLKRLVTSHLLNAEAKRLKLADTSEFKKDIADYAEGLNYRRYINELRKNITLNDDELKQFEEQFKDKPDAISAAKSELVASKFKSLLKLTLMKLRDSYHVKMHEDQITKDIKPDTLLMEGDDGLQLSYGELAKAEHFKETPDKAVIQEALYKQAELLLLGKAAQNKNYDNSQALENYKQERLAAALIEQKKKEWIPNETVIQSYFKKHPSAGVIKDRWHIGQLVLKTKEEAEKAYQQIKSGKATLFQLAGKLSIDPYGKKNNGDMGWVAQGKGMPKIEEAIKDLKDGEISNIIETSKGFHIVTILKRRPGETLPFATIKDKLTQMFLSEKLRDYLKELEKKHEITWKIMETDPNKVQSLLKSKGVQ